MLETVKKQKYILILALLLFIVTIFAAFQYKKAKKLSYMRDMEYNRVFAELTEYVDDIEISLLKGQVVSDKGQMAKLSADLYTQSSGAKANLARLPISEVRMEKTTEFLSQVGEYAAVLSSKLLKGEDLSEKERKTMSELTQYAKKLKKNLDETLAGINEGQIMFEESLPNRIFSGGKADVANELSELEDAFHNYPSLIYDGPFSQHLSLRESELIKGKNEITKREVKEKAKKFTKNESVSLSEIGGKIDIYSVKSESVVTEYTKKGGILLLMMRDRNIKEEKITRQEAAKNAQAFLRENGFYNMRESYYDKREGAIVINYAYEEDGYIAFPDLIKVKVALDNGEIIGFESRGYVMNHTEREIPPIKTDEKKALEKVSEYVDVKSVEKAIIPLESGKEAFCHQIKGIVENKNFLMYVNTQTGYTEDVRILLETDGGTLAV